MSSNRFEKLEDAFDLPALTDDSFGITPSVQEVAAALERAGQLEEQFERIDGFDQHDVEMDELAGLAVQAHKDLQDLGMNVEIRHAGEIFSSSSQMLKIAVDAKNNKVEKKLKLLRLQIDKMRIDKMNKTDDNNTIDGNAVSIDRNELLQQLRELNAKDK